MEIGIDSFAGGMRHANVTGANNATAMEELLDRITFADKMGLAVFGIGEHYRKEFLDAAPAVILSAAAAKTKHIKLTSAVTVLSAADPVRAFQQYATLDLISKGRAEMVVGRGSFIDSFPLFGLDLNNYDALFSEKLNLLLKINTSEKVTWQGKFRPALDDQAIYPRPFQQQIPVWLGVGGTPASFRRAGELGLPLMVAVIGGETHRFRPLIDLYRQAGKEAGHSPEALKVGLHSLGFVAQSREEAIEKYYPGYAEMFTKIGKERGWGPVTMQSFLAQTGKQGAIVIGSAEEVAEKIKRHSAALGGISRFTFQMDNAGLSHAQLLEAIQLIGEKVIPLVHS